jgi:hypothetical protein
MTQPLYDDLLVALIDQWLDTLPPKGICGCQRDVYARLGEFAGADAVRDWWPEDPGILRRRLMANEKSLAEVWIYVDAWFDKNVGFKIGLVRW